MRVECAWEACLQVDCLAMSTFLIFGFTVQQFLVTYYLTYFPNSMWTVSGINQLIISVQRMYQSALSAALCKVPLAENLHLQAMYSMFRRDERKVNTCNYLWATRGTSCITCLWETFCCFSTASVFSSHLIKLISHLVLLTETGVQASKSFLHVPLPSDVKLKELC